MNLIQAIVCILSVSLVASQVPTFASTPVSSSSSVVTVSTASSLSGTLVTFSAAGWVVSADVIAATPTAGTISFIVTPLLAAASTSVGLIQSAGTGTTPANAAATGACSSIATAFSGKTTLEGGATSTSTCFSDFASLYTAAATTTTTDTTNLAYGGSNAKLIVGVPTTVAITPVTTAAATACHQIAFTTASLSTVQATTTTGTCPTAASDSAYALKYASGNTATFAFYINAGGKAAVCLQTAANYQSAPACGYGNYYGKSSSILSVLVAPILAISAIFLH